MSSYTASKLSKLRQHIKSHFIFIKKKLEYLSKPLNDSTVLKAQKTEMMLRLHEA